jgi:hypothetical protein
MAETVDMAEAARMLRTVVETLPPRTTTERATARRIEGAALALKVLAEPEPRP